MSRLPPPPLPDWIERMLPGFTRYRVDVGGELALHVMERGQGLPVVMFHGNPTWGFLYRKVAAELPLSDYRVILPDLFGLGLSDKPRDPSRHTLPEHATRMARLLGELELERMIVVVQDWGGPIGLLAAAMHAPRVAGLVVLNTVVGPPRAGFRPSGFHRFARLPIASDLIFHRLGFPQNVLAFAQGDRRSISGDVARAYRWPLRDHRDAIAPLALARMVPDSLEHPSIPPLQRCEEFVTAFQGPVEIVWGDRDPVIGKARSRVEKMLPRARVTRTAAGHFLQEEVPDVIAAAVRRVAERVIRA